MYLTSAAVFSLKKDTSDHLFLFYEPPNLVNICQPVLVDVVMIGFWKTLPQTKVWMINLQAPKCTSGTITRSSNQEC